MRIWLNTDGIKEKKILKSLGDFGYLSTLVVSADGKKLYLVGTPGDPEREGMVQRSYNTRANTRAAAQMTDTMQELSRLKKTVTIIDAETGETRTVITVGSFPRGAAVTEK